MRPLVCILGPTATGKTALALHLASLFPSVLISADSRQVYRGMDIVTGKDHSLGGVPVYGVDLVAPDEPCSVAVWYSHILSPLTTSNLPLLVGGTGLYIKAVTSGIASLNIPPNLALRSELGKMPVATLQARLKELSPSKLLSMNQSDINNPHRLLRALEIASSPSRPSLAPLRFCPLFIGLKYLDKSKYERTVRSRVISRLDHGAVEETKELIQHYDSSLPSLSALGYKHILKFISGKSSRPKLIDSWTRDELAYAKRQLTWFNKLEGVYWFDPQASDLKSRVAELVKSWYHNS